jgi:hypothetical protein
MVSRNLPATFLKNLSTKNKYITVSGIVWKSFPHRDLKYTSVQIKIAQLATLWTTSGINVEIRNICTQNLGQKISRSVDSGQNVCESEDTFQWRFLLNPVQNLHTSPHFCMIHLFTFLVPPAPFQVFGVKSVNRTLRPLSWKIKKFWPQPTEDFIYPPELCLYTGHQPLKDIEIRVGNSSTDLQRNPLCAWFPGTIGEMHANWQLLSLCYLWCTAMSDIFLALIAFTTAWFMGSVDLTVLQMEQRVSETRSLSVFRCKGVEELQVFWYITTYRLVHLPKVGRIIVPSSSYN